MNWTFLVGVAPLVIATGLYIAQALGYNVVFGRPGMSVALVGYAIANIGLVADALGWRS